MNTPHAGMICHEVESVRDGEWDVRDGGGNRMGRGFVRYGLGKAISGVLRPNAYLTESIQHPYTRVNSLHYGRVSPRDLPLERVNYPAEAVLMSTRRQNPEASLPEADAMNRGDAGPPRFLFFFRGRRRSVQSAGSRSKANGALEFWVLLALAAALIAIVLLVCLRGTTASR